MSAATSIESEPEVRRRMTVRGFFARNGPLAGSHPSYEYRPGQLQMALAVESAIAEKRHLIVEAGTGTGKTLAYLVPSILSGKRIVISTGTKNLQEQLFFKDIPFLQQFFERPFSVCYMKGRANYLCRQKLYDAERERMLEGLEEMKDYRMIREWEPQTETGDRSELRLLPENSAAWWKLDARSDLCAGQKCKQFDRCFITAMHQRAAESDIIVVNHHLFFADLALREEPMAAIIPDYEAVIFDEAHEIEDIAGQYFGMSVSNLQVQELVKDTGAIARQKLFTSPELDRALVHLQDRSEEFFALFPHDTRQAFRNHEQFLDKNEQVFTELLFSLDALCTRLELVQNAIDYTLALVRRAKNIYQGLRYWVMGEDTSCVYWTERRGRGFYLQATPIDVSKVLAKHLVERTPSVILTSATLTVAGAFDYSQTRLGLENARTALIESQYDYRQQALLYVPPHLPDPRSAEFARKAADEIEWIVDYSRGRAFVLFTSHQQMRQIHELLRRRLDYPLLLQGDAPKTALLETFRETPHAVLFGTSSFWQGVDVQGEQLSCVIIDRLPFAVPSDPVIAARSDAISRAGGNPFYEYQIPQAALALKQGFGRLIRATSDRGVLALLDNRITRQSYGKIFFSSLPPYRFTNKLGDVQQFFDV